MSTCPVVRIKSSHPASQGDFIEINKADFDESKHVLHVEVPLPPPPVLPPPPPAGPLANLPKNWRDGKTSALRELAEKVTGRTPETREQAVQMVEANLTSAK